MKALVTLALTIAILTAGCERADRALSTPAPQISTPTGSPTPSSAVGLPEETPTGVYAYELKKDCYPSNRTFFRAHPVVVTAPAVLTAAVRELLRRFGGPGLLRSVDLQGGVATIDFESFVGTGMAWAGTSCGASAFWGSINATVYQFPTVDGVRYEFAGSCEAFYEFMQSSCSAYGPAGTFTRAEWEASPWSGVPVKVASRQ